MTIRGVRSLAILPVVCILSLLAFGQEHAVPATSPRVIREIKHDVSLPLSELSRMTPAQPHPFSPRMLRILPTSPSADVPEVPVHDQALQQVQLPPVAAVVGLNFDGLGLGEYGFRLEFNPPDSNGAVGATQYVQWVNTEFAVFDKSTGALLAGPTPGNALWHGFGGGCQANNDGDPIVEYDKAADRWILTQFSISTLPYLQCVAVSTTNDATGTYHRYAFSFGDTDFSDYPKLGVWPDAYYMSFNLFLNGTTFMGADACALDRNAMLAGNSAQIICFPQNSSIASLLPSDVDGTLLPSTGEPSFFMNFGTNTIQLWSFHVDFNTPANSTFTGPTVLPVAAFTPLCLHSCVKQPGTNQKLDALGDRPMYRLAYRRFADGTEALMFNHSISSGIRWYEVRSPNSAPTVFQQGTFGPDSNTRWMGSIAMDQSGDMALGYSQSSTSVYPSIDFTGRVAADASGTMEGEQLIASGLGSQMNGITRWGDYSAMTIDPADDCTFWYTQEYILSNGSYNWNTRIVNFKFPNCGPPSGANAVLSPSSLTFPATPIGQTVSKNVTLSNTGTAALQIDNVATTGDFAVQSNTCGTQLLAGNNCSLTVGFTPTVKATRTGVLALTDNAPNNPQTATLKGTGVSITVTPPSFGFGSVPVGQASQPQAFTIANVSPVAVKINSIKLSGAAVDFPILANNCGTSLAAGSNCAVQIIFQPVKTGTLNAKLTIGNNGGGSAISVLTGTGQ